MKNLDLLLVHPSGRKKIYQNLSEDFSAIEPPYIAALTANFIRSKGFSVKILDANAEGYDIQETFDAIKQYNPSLISIIVHGQQPSASTQMMPGVGELCEYIKNNSDYKILLTGNHPSALPEKTLIEESVDFVGRGEGYGTHLALLQGANFSKVPGLFYLENGRINFEIDERVLNSDEMNQMLTTAAWDLLPMKKYKAHNWHCFDDIENRKPYASIYTSFGCGMGCTFCMIDDVFSIGQTQKSKIRCRDPKIVVDEIENLVRNYEIKNIKFIDEMFVLNPKHYLGIADEIIKRDLGKELNIWAYSRIDTVKEGNLDILKKSGINWLALGIESGNQNVRQEVQKGRFNENKIQDIVQKIKNAGIYASCNYIFGLPEDTKESMQETLDLAIELNGEWANFYCAMAYPGSELYRNAKKEKIELPEDVKEIGWIGYSQHSYRCYPLPTKNLSRAEVLKFRDESFEKYFKGEKYLEMIKNKFGKKVEEHIQEMNKIKLKRKLFED